MAFYNAKTLTILEVNQKRLESFEMWGWRRMEKIRRNDRVKNKKTITQRQRRNKYPTYNKKEEGQVNW
jgi:hypothetical protein